MLGEGGRTRPASGGVYGVLALLCIREVRRGVQATMFENILSQETATGRLVKEYRNDRVPNSMLFVGPEYSGKLSTALELARGLTCAHGAEWTCGCHSCVLQRPLLHPSILLAGDRYFIQEIIAAGETLKREGTRAARFLYVRAVRKLLRRLDSVLWEGEENRIAKALDQLARCEETMEPLVPNGELPPDYGKTVDETTDCATRVIHALPHDVVPVSVVRRMTAWAHTAGGGRKVVILENVDRLGESARNALLKILEEPPRDLHFVLTTSRRGAVLPTIRSRCREYHFRERTVQEAGEVVQRVFRGPEQPQTIRSFFLGHEFPGAGDLGNYAARFLRAAEDPQDPEHETGPVSELAKALRAAPEREAFRHFLEEMLTLLRDRLRDGRMETRRADFLRRLIHRQYERADTYNISIELLLERLYYAVRHRGAA